MVFFHPSSCQVGFLCCSLGVFSLPKGSLMGKSLILRLWITSLENIECFQKFLMLHKRVIRHHTSLSCCNSFLAFETVHKGLFFSFKFYATQAFFLMMCKQMILIDSTYPLILPTNLKCEILRYLRNLIHIKMLNSPYIINVMRI